MVQEFLPTKGKKILGIVLWAFSLVSAVGFVVLTVMIGQFTASAEQTQGGGVIAASFANMGFAMLAPSVLLAGIVLAVIATILFKEKLWKLLGGGSIALNLGLLVYFFAAYGKILLAFFG